MTKNCPVCHSSVNNILFTHKKWKIPVLQCGNCTHVFASQFINEKEDNFETNNRRALFYLNSLFSMRPESMMDIGTPADFFLLKEAHKRFPSAKKYALDIYEKDHPDFVELINHFPDFKLDICTAFHVLEHVEEPHQFISSVMNASDNFIIEVPNCDTKRKMIPSSCNPHMHFFNINSLEALFGELNENIKFMTRSGKDMLWGRSVLVAYRLPEGCPIINQKQTAGDLLRTIGTYLKFARRRLAHEVRKRVK